MPLAAYSGSGPSAVKGSSGSLGPGAEGGLVGSWPPLPVSCPRPDGAPAAPAVWPLALALALELAPLPEGAAGAAPPAFANVVVGGAVLTAGCAPGGFGAGARDLGLAVWLLALALALAGVAADAAPPCFAKALIGSAVSAAVGTLGAFGAGAWDPALAVWLPPLGVVWRFLASIFAFASFLEKGRSGLIK